MNRTEHNTNSTLIKNIHYFLQNGEKQIKYSPKEDIVLLLGNTGSGKSALTQYVSGNAHTLLSQEVEEDTGEYLIVDTKKKISGKSTIVSQTIYPDLIKDAKTNTHYYDCPGFSDTRSAAHEIAATYFIKKVIDLARSVKMVFVVSHHSVSRGADRQDFILMLQHATDFLKQIEKYKKSIALIVTKIENRYVGDKIVSDEKVINAIGKYLEQAKEDINEHTEMISPDRKNKVLSLLDIFLTKGENEQYTRIGIFRKPNKSGLISEIELMKEGKIFLENLITKNIQFVKVSDKDFGYTVSAKSKVHVSALAEEINKTIVKELLNMGKEVENFCITQEEIISDLEYLILRFQNLQTSFSNIQNNAIRDTITTEKFINEINGSIKYFNITIPVDYITTVEREGDYINFLNLVSNQSIKSNKSSLLASGLSKLTEYLSDSYSFYRFLNNIYQRLTEYDLQKIRDKYKTINLNELNDLFESSIFKEIEPIFKEHHSIRKMKLNKPKLKLLNRVLDQTLKYEIETTIPAINRIVVKGVNVKISEMLSKYGKLLNNEHVKFIEVYALHKVFIDTSLDLTGREIQMAIVSPVWEVIGSQSIILEGKPGRDYYEKAKSGVGYGENGLDGIPGEPGGPAGNFIGIGKQYLNEEYLHISTNGGKGGRGQDGGDGMEGYDGAHCPKSCRTNEITAITGVYNQLDYDYPGGKGGDGGGGGIGGYGGHKGSIYLIKVGAQSQVVYAKQTAHDGLPGTDGIGGSGGKGGQYFWYKIKNVAIIIHTETFEPYDKWAQNGLSGQTGIKEYGRKATWQLTKLINLNNTKTEYKDYLLNNINHNLQEMFLTTFLHEIENNRTSITQPTNRKRRNIMTGQYAGEGNDNYYLDLYRHLDDSIDISKPVSRNSFLEAESAKQIPLKPIFPIPKQLENMKTEKDINIIDQYSSTNLHGNLLLAEMALKKLMRKEIPPSHTHKDSPKEGTSSAHDLAYSHYLAN